MPSEFEVKIEKLKGENNLQNWKKVVLLQLGIYGLQKYVATEIPKTEANLGDRYKVTLLIQSSLSDEVQTRLTNGGSKTDETDPDPKKLYDDIFKIIPAASENAIAELVEEFCRIRRKNFASFHKYLERVCFLRRRLQELIPEFKDEVCIWIALAGIKEYPFYTHLMVQMKEKKLDWEVFTRELTVEANRESADTLFAQPKTYNQNNNNAAGVDLSKVKGAHRIGRSSPHGVYEYHPACKQVHPGGDARCWKLHPELRPASTQHNNKQQNQSDAMNDSSRPSSSSVKFQSGIHGVMVQLPSHRIPSPYELTKDSLVIDSGASSHTFNDPTWFDSLTVMENPEVFGSANGGQVVTSHRGLVRFAVKNSAGQTVDWELGAVYSPNAPCNLISLGKLRDDGAVVDGYQDKIVQKNTKQELAQLSWVSNVSVLKNVNRPEKKTVALAQLRTSTVSFDVMHQRLGHANKDAVVKACRDVGIKFPTKEVKDHHCEACFVAKARDFIPKTTTKKYEIPLEMVRVDVIVHDAGHLGYRYTTHFLDVATGFHWLKFHKTKAEAQTALKEWILQMETQTDLKVREIGIDGGGEFGQGTQIFFNNPMRNWLKTRGTILLQNTPHTPWYNGSSERAGQSITSYARALLLAAGLPPLLWPFAEETAAKVLNLLPSKTDPWGKNRSSWEQWMTAIGAPENEWKPYIHHLRIYGCTTYAYIKKENRKGSHNRFQPRARKGQLVGYDDDYGRIYWIYFPDDGKFMRASAVKFHEEIPPQQPSDEPEPEYEVVLDDPGLTEEVASFKVRVVDDIATTPKEKPSPEVITKIIDKSDDNPYRTPEATPDPEVTILPDVAASDLTDDRVTELPELPELSDEEFQDASELLDDNEDDSDHTDDDSPDNEENNDEALPPGSPSGPGGDQEKNDEEEEVPLDDEVSIPRVTEAVVATAGRPQRAGTARPTGYYKDLAAGKIDKDKRPLLFFHKVNLPRRAPRHYHQPCVSLLQAILMATPRSERDVPTNFRQARKSPDYYTHWLPAMERQMKRLQDLGTWSLVDRPAKAKVLPGKWVYDEKITTDGETLERARWVVCGNFAADGGFANNYAAVASATSVRLCLTITAVKDFILWGFDVNTAFLYAKMPPGVEIFVEQPYGVSGGSKVCLLHRALYGLREAPLYWFLTISPIMKELGFEPFDSDLCLFYSKTLNAFVALYVDDLLVSAATKAIIYQVRDHLLQHFQLKDLGEAKTFLGYEIHHDKDSKKIYLSQHRYSEKMLEEFGWSAVNSVQTPWPEGLELPKLVDNSNKIDETRQKDYIKKTGKLNYLSIGTRADITYTVSKLCEANSKASEKHCQLLKHLARYIKGSLGHCVVYGGDDYTIEDLKLTGFADASFADCTLTRYSTGGHVVKVAGGPVFWKTKRQTVITTSSTEAEFINLTPAGISLNWINKMLGEFGAPQKKPLLLVTDSANALATALNPMNSARTRSVDLRYKWIIDQVAKGFINLQHLAGTDMVADGLTKPLGRLKHAQFVKLLGLESRPDQKPSK